MALSQTRSATGKRLVDLNPRWIDYGGKGARTSSGRPIERHRGIGMTFDCPCGCGRRRGVEFEVGLDGKPWHGTQAKWARTGETFETITLRPSIRAAEPDGCGWHGYITNGIAKAV